MTVADSTASLRARLAVLGRELGGREASHREALERAWGKARRLRIQVAEGLAGFREAVVTAGAPHLEISLEEPHLDDKHVRAVEFALQRGRHRAIVTVKSRGEVTLVGPFRQGKAEGPCRSFGWEDQAEIDEALAAFLERFLEEAATP